ncbi:CGNR zinc finger domain-containing protein [Dactylosporangium vinaceum]|uniref:CGNR zinc finger domain-containing protein n=1 Tax=Dactylosporangium vinaceum TaxID=53362 RepID=A0ABV5MR18_9ACTN|nr:ABATE domain-containing protein [Dactylosporangium vinaceum]UAC00576.1 CGNR zinc finger domain-containing protein [Dactylosporangium vinaceum]
MTFVFVSGDLALDFAATLKWRRGPDPEELLATGADAARWAVEAGVLSRPPRVGEEELRALLVLREAVYSALHPAAAAPRPADIRVLNRAAAQPGPRPALTALGVRRSGDATALGAAVAVAAIALLESRPPIRECAGEACTRLFVDRSRAGNRTWCGMEECGNRVKAASYRARRARE